MAEILRTSCDNAQTATGRVSILTRCARSSDDPDTLRAKNGAQPFKMTASQTEKRGSDASSWLGRKAAGELFVPRSARSSGATMRQRSGVRTRRCADDGGAVLVEAALITPLFVFLLFGTLEFGGLFKDYLTMNDASASGARAAAIAGNDANADYQILQGVKSSMNALTKTGIKKIIVYQGHELGHCGTGRLQGAHADGYDGGRHQHGTQSVQRVCRLEPEHGRDRRFRELQCNRDGRAACHARLASAQLVPDRPQLRSQSHQRQRSPRLSRPLHRVRAQVVHRPVRRQVHADHYHCHPPRTELAAVSAIVDSNGATVGGPTRAATAGP